MKTIILTQKKYSISLKESGASLDKFIAEIFLLAKTLKEEKDRGMTLSQAGMNPVEQSIEVTVTASPNQMNQSSSSPSYPSSQPQTQSQPQGGDQQPRNMPPRPTR